MIVLFALLLIDYSVTSAPANRFTLEVEKTGLMKGKKHVFSFPNYSGTMQFDVANPTDAKVQFTIPAAGMVCQDTWVKEGDRKKILDWALNKMIEVRQHPQLHFVSNRVERTGADRFNVVGALTMRGVAHPALITVTTTPNGAGWTLNGVSELNMKEWGMDPPSAGLGTVGTKPVMHVGFQLLFTPSK